MTLHGVTFKYDFYECSGLNKISQKIVPKLNVVGVDVLPNIGALKMSSRVTSLQRTVTSQNNETKPWSRRPLVLRPLQLPPQTTAN